MTDLDLDFVRAQFPAFSEPSLAGFAHFENAGGSYACRQTIEWLNRYYRQTKVQPYYAFEPSRLAGEQMDAARDRLAAWLNVGSDELHFGPSSSQNTYVIAQALRRFLSPGDEVIVTTQDHEANSGSFSRLKDDGFVVREWKVDPVSAELNQKDLEALLNSRTRVVAFTHCSNVVGSINLVRELTDLVHRAGAWAFVDGVAFSPHGLPDIEALGADLYFFSLYKVYGPHLGAMFLRRELNAQLPNQGHFFNADYPAKRFTPAGPDHAQIAAVNGVMDYMEAVAARHGAGGKPIPEQAERSAQAVPAARDCTAPAAARLPVRSPQGAIDRQEPRRGARTDRRLHGGGPELRRSREAVVRIETGCRRRQFLRLPPHQGAGDRHGRRRGARFVRALHVAGRSRPPGRGPGSVASGTSAGKPGYGRRVS